MIVDLSNKGFKLFPTSIGELTQELDISNNQLTELPEHIQNLTELKWLSLSTNLISISEQEKIKKLLPTCKIIF
jgi:Leucine-rich repeat (LRR) protein